MAKAVEQLPWLRNEHYPTLRAWAELELIRRCAFAGIVQGGALRVDSKNQQVEVKRLVHDHRQIAIAQLAYARELGMSALARAQLSDQAAGEFDLVAAMTQQSSEPETAVEAEVDGEPETET